MSEGRAFDLLTAAGLLAAAGRAESARAVLATVARDEGPALRAATLRAAAAGQSDLTWLGVAALIRTLPERDGTAAAAAAWGILSASARERGQGFDHWMFQLRLALMVSEPRLAPPRSGGADLCYVLGQSLPHDATGYAMRSQALVRALMARGKSVQCLTRPGFPWDRGVAYRAPADRVEGVVYHRTGSPGDHIPRTPDEFLAAGMTMVRALRKLHPKRIMAASNYETAIPALFAARRLGVPFIYEVRGFWELSLATREPDYAGSPAYELAYALEAAVAVAADLVLTLNGAMRDELVRRGVARDRIALLPNAADTQVLRPASRDAGLAARLDLPEEVPVIGYIGSFTDYEGLEDLIAACADLAGRGQDFRLLLVGWDPRGENRIGPALKATAADLGISDRLIMPGNVARDTVPAWYSLIDIAPVPRRRFPVTELVSPLKPLEAMAMAKAVVLSDLPPLAEMLRPGETGCLFPAGDRAALADVLTALVADPERRRRLGAAARQVVVDEHSWEERADTCWKTLESVKNRVVSWDALR